MKITQADKDTLDAAAICVGVIRAKASHPYSQERHIALLESGFTVYRRDEGKITFIRQADHLHVSITLQFPGEKSARSSSRSTD